jgi:hypothetical protein
VPPSVVAARQALTAVPSACSKLEQQLALVEMLLAVGPEVRDRGTLEQALDALELLENEFAAHVAKLLGSCAAIRTDSAVTPPPSTGD